MVCTIVPGHNFFTKFVQDMADNSGNVVSMLKKQMIHQACQLKDAERRISLLMNRHNKMTGLLRTTNAGFTNKDQCIEQLEAKLKQRDDKA